MQNRSSPADNDEVLRVISYFATSIYHLDTVEEILWDVTKNCIHRLGLVDCVIYLLDEERQVLVQRAAYGNKNPLGRHIYNRLEIPLGSGIVGAVAVSGLPEMIGDVTKDTRYIVDDEARASELAVPILLDNRVIGVIDSEHPEKNFFQVRHLDIFTILASLCSQKIQSLQTVKKRRKLTRDNNHYPDLIRLLETEHVYRNPDLSLDMLADQLGISPTYLSYLINDVTGLGFADFINGYRVEDAKGRLRDPHYAHYTVMAIGQEAGFNSKTTFFTTFRKLTGQSPAAYRKG